MQEVSQESNSPSTMSHYTLKMEISHKLEFNLVQELMEFNSFMEVLLVHSKVAVEEIPTI